MLRRGPGEVAAEVVAVDKLHLAEIAGGESANGRAVEGDLGELAGVEVQRGRRVGVAPCYAGGLIVSGESAAQPVAVFEVDGRFAFAGRAGLAKGGRCGQDENRQ